MRRTLARIVGRLAAPLFVALVAASAIAVQAPAGDDVVDLPDTQEVLGVQGQIHYLPFAGPQFLALLRGEHGSDLPSAAGTVTSPVRLIASMVSALDGNDVYLDHWEDGYDADPIASPGATTEHFAMDEGDTQVFDNWVNTSTPNVIDYDGGDRIVSTGAVVITAGGWPTGAATLHANAAVVPDVDDYGFDFVAPVGESTPFPASDATKSLWEYTGFLVLAAEDDTHVTVDGATAFDLDAGQSHLVDGDVDMGEGVHADKPVLVYLATGDQQPGSGAYEGRIYRLRPTELWSDAYMTPIGAKDTGNNATRVFLYNPSTSAISVTVTESGGATSSISVPASGQASHRLPANGGATYSSPGHPFYALQAITTPESGSTDNSASFNWGIALTPIDALTPMVVVGYGPGADGLTENDSGVYVSAVANTTLYIDLDGNRATGANTDPNGNKYDASCALTTNTPVVIKDAGASTTCVPVGSYSRAAAGGDNDLTGARIYTTSGVSIAAAWGQIPGAAQAGAPAIDMGTTVLPFPTIDLSKDAEIVGDDGDGEAVPGDTIRYTITITNRGISPVDDLVVNDQVPDHTTYVAGSTVANGDAITDPATGTPFPLDEGGLLVPPVLNPGETRTVAYDLLVDDPLPPGVTEIVNEITLESDYGTYTDSNVQPVADPGTIGDRVWNDPDGDGTQDGGEPGIPGVTVDLRNADGDVVASTTTGADGAYSFSNVYPGDYSVRIDTDTLPAGMTGTYDLDGIGTADRAAVTLAAAQTRTDVDFGYVAASISLAKTVYAGHDDGAGCAANTNDLVSGETTDDVTWCFAVTNTGPVGLVDVTLDDPDLGIDHSNLAVESGNPATLAAGQSVVWSYDGDIAGALVNDATATAHLSPGGPSRTATDSAEVRVVGPGITLAKTAYRGHDAGASCDGQDDVTVEQGGPLTYCFRVTNSGQTNLSAVTFSDPDLGIDEGDLVHALLTPGQSHTFHVEVTATTDLVNTATATGTSPAGVQPESTDTVDVDVVHPAISLQKTVYAGHDGGAGCATAGESLVRRTGDPVTWCFDVANDGDVALSDLTVDDLPLDADEGDLSVTSGSLDSVAAGGHVRLYLQTTADDDVANEATATGQPPVGPAVSADDTASLDVILPAIAVDKTVYRGHDAGAGCTGADELTAGAGDDVTYCFEATNTGDSPLTGITVDDLDLDDSGLTLLSGSVTPLAAGQSAVWYLEAVVDGDLDNTASVTGTPPVGEDVTDEDTASADEIHPDLTVEKTVYGGHDDGAQCDTAGDVHHDEDDTPDTWCFTVTNTGDATLTDLRIDDPVLDVDQDDLAWLSDPTGALDPGETVVGYLEDTLTDDVENTAIATATPPVGEDVTDTDTATVEVQVPSVAIEKTVYAGHDGGASCDDGVESIIARSGAAVTWCLLVTNTGDTDVATTVSDPAVGLSQAQDLEPGESTTLHVDDVVDGDLTNTATVSGSSPGGHPVEDSDDAAVDEVHPSITLDKAVYRGHDSGAGCATAEGFVDDEAGHPITWCFHVHNDGDVTLTDVTLDDVPLGVDETDLVVPAGALDALDPGESVDLYLATTLTDDLENSATVTAVAPVGPDVTDDGEASVDLLEPGVAVEKTVYRGHDAGAGCADGSDSIVARPDAEVTWCFLVTNTGETDLRVTVEDPQLPDFESDVLRLGPGESQTVWYETTVAGDLDNTVSVTGETPDHHEVPATDDAQVTEIHPDIAVDKTVYSGHDGGAHCGDVDVDDHLEAEVDEDVTWCFRIENTGDVDLTDVRLDDDELDVTESDVALLDDADLAVLAVDGVVWAYVEDVVEGPIVNDVTATGTAPDDDDVSATASADIEAVGPQIGVAKEIVEDEPVANGDGSYTLTYRLRVTNSGRTRLRDVQVVDDLTETFGAAAGFVVDDVTATDGLHLDPDYDGRPGGSVELLTGEDVLGEGQTGDIDIVVTVTPGAFLGPYLNTAHAAGTSPVGVEVEDDSDSGSDAHPSSSNPGEPGDTEGTDDPVPVSFPPVDLTVTKSVEERPDPNDLAPRMVWGVVVQNEGPGDDSGPITVTDVLEPRLSFVSATGAGWECSHEGRTVTCVWDAPLAAGRQTSMIRLTTGVTPGGDDTITNSVHGRSPVAERRPDTNDSAAEVTAGTVTADPPSTLPRTGVTIVGLVLLGLGLVFGGRLLQRRARGVAA
jgi:uncharacterized repeat protein (TIGR01451 family)